MSNVKWGDLPDSTPLEYEQENQKRPGSKSHDLYERYKKSKTYGEAKANGARPEDFRHDYGKGWLKLQPADGEIPLVPPKNGEKKAEGSSKRPSKDGGSKKSKEDDEPIWQEEKRDPEQIQQDLKKQEQLSKELNELKNDQYKKRERPKDAFEMAMEAFSKGSSKSSKIKVTEAAALDVKLEKAHKQLQKETMEQLEKARKEKAEKTRMEAEKAALEKAREEAKVKTEKARSKAPEKTPEKPEKGSKTERKLEKIEKSEKAEVKAEKKEVKSEKSDKIKDKSDKEKKLKKDKKEKKHKKDKKHKKHKSREHKKSETQGAKKPRLSASRIRELLRSKVMAKDKLNPKTFEQGRQDEKGLYIRHSKREYASVYLGVSPAPGQTKEGRPAWRARFEGTLLGTFESEEEAARAYAKARSDAAGSNGVETRPSPASQDKIPDSLQDTVEVLQRQINELKPQQLDKLMEYFKAEITWRADDAEDFNFDLKTYSVPRLRELTRRPRELDTTQATIHKLELELAETRAKAILKQPGKVPKATPPGGVWVSWATGSPPKPPRPEPPPISCSTTTTSFGGSGTRLIRQVRAETNVPQAPQAATPLDANERHSTGSEPMRLQQSKPQGPGTQIPTNQHHERELQDKIRELEQRNQHQQRQIEEQKAQMIQMQAAQVHVQDPRFGGQNSYGGSSGSTRPNGAPNETWKVAQEAMSQALQVPHASLPPGGRWPAGYIGDGGGWVPGGEPPKNAQPPAIPPGDTEPPGRCVENCRCGQVVSRAWEVEKPWLKDEARAMAIMAAIHRFESQPSVERRGKVSKQNRYEPAAPQALAVASTSNMEVLRQKWRAG